MIAQLFQNLFNQTNETNKINQTNQTNKINQTNQTNKINQTNQTNKINQNNETNQINKINQSNETNKIYYENNTNDSQSNNNLSINSSISLESLDAIIEDIEINSYFDTLKEKGYVIIPNVYNQNEIETYIDEFNEWRSSIPNIDYLHNLIEYNGIYKYHQIGHQRFAWLARTNPKILNIFKKLWNTDELVCSFDGCCFYSNTCNDTPHYWTHTDQSSLKKGVHCYQSFLSLTNNKERTMIIYEGTHKYHESYFDTMNIVEPNDWNIINKDYLFKNHIDKQHFLNVNAGDLVIWDSRTFHQSTPGSYDCNEERLVQYLCYLPKNNSNNSDEQRNIRKHFFNTKKTTNHWPYPMNAVSEQPNHYNYYNDNSPIYIDYDKLPTPYLDDLIEDINKLL